MNVDVSGKIAQKLLRDPYLTQRLAEAVIISNAGGRVDNDAIRSVVVLDGLLGVGTVIVVEYITPVTIPVMRRGVPI